MACVHCGEESGKASHCRACMRDHAYGEHWHLRTLRLHSQAIGGLRNESWAAPLTGRMAGSEGPPMHNLPIQLPLVSETYGDHVAVIAENKPASLRAVFEALLPPMPPMPPIDPWAYGEIDWATTLLSNPSPSRKDL